METLKERSFSAIFGFVSIIAVAVIIAVQLAMPPQNASAEQPVDLRNARITVGEGRQVVCHGSISIRQLVDAGEPDSLEYRSMAYEKFARNECTTVRAGQVMEVVLVDGPSTLVTYHDGRALQLMAVETRWLREGL